MDSVVRVGRYNFKNLKEEDYKKYFPDYEICVVMMKSHRKYYPLSPYSLKDDKGRILENIWQFSKVYKEVPQSKQYYSQYDKTVIWEWPRNLHYKKDTVPEKCNVNDYTNDFFDWRRKGMYNEYAVRYPVGFANRGKVLFQISPEVMVNDKIAVVSGNIYGYIEGRKNIYRKMYLEMVRCQPVFLQLKKKYESGTNILILEVDGPHEQDCRNLGIDFEHNTIIANKENLDKLINYPGKAYGHGYCLAEALLGFE